MSNPDFKLTLDPSRNSPDNNSLEAARQKPLDNLTYAVTLIGEAKGWGGNPRWDLVIEAGLKALVNEKK